ncbi:ras-related protein Rab-44-like isoform X2 [Megalops cyprinoides]|uniref:ras-related protein Rab-44-like isoform X2 n=1 Tax=Megalops cyprinoides TaxID=118141 RepID=UPI0018652B9B|nr:ras-related protein Rab-44-like isoform X2 [Megalops cyprinoides]
MKKKEEDGADSDIKEYEAKETKEVKTETKQMDEEHLEGEEHDDSWSTNRKRKTSSFHKSCPTAKNQRGRRLGEEREVEEGELGGMDKEEQDEMHAGGEADGREKDEEAVLNRREEEGEAVSGVQEYETKERQDRETGKKVCAGHAESERHEDSGLTHRRKKIGSSRRGLFGAKKQTEKESGWGKFGVERGGEYEGERENEEEGQTVMENVENVTSHLQSPPLQVSPPHADSSVIESSFELERGEASFVYWGGSEQPRDPTTEEIQEGLSEDTERKVKKQEVKSEKEKSVIEETKEETPASLIMDSEKNKGKLERKEEIRQGKAQAFVSSLYSAGQPEITNHPDTQLPPAKRKLGSSRRARSSALKAERDLGRTDQRGRGEDPKVAAILQKIQDVFHRWDIEEKGFITWEEMQGLGRELDISAAELQQVFERLDVDRDGLITPQDFTAGFQELIQFQQHKAKTPAFVYQSDASILPEEVDDDDRKRFMSILDDLGAYKILQERIQEHNVGVQELYEEMERQISTEKERANRESSLKSCSQVAEMEEQLVKKNSEIQELISVQDELEGSLQQLLRQQQQTTEENQELCRTNQELEAQLKRIRGQLHDTLRHIRGVRRSIDRGASLPRLQRLASAPEGAGGEEVPSPQVVPDVQVFERFGSMVDQEFWQDRCTGPADVKRGVRPQNSAPHKRLISIEEDPLPDLVSLGQPAPPRHGEVLWENQRGPTREGRQSMSDSSPALSVPDVLYNVVLVGNSSVGKTSFMKRFQSGEFSLEHCATIGLDSCIQTLLVDGARVILQLWDTAGQERYHSITKQILRKAQGLILMYDITSSQTFLAVRDWLSCIQEGAPDDVIIILLGNKNDSSTREVSYEEGERLARENQIHFMECSAATGDNVSQSMQTLARILKQKVDEQLEVNVTLHKEPQKKKKSGCC